MNFLSICLMLSSLFFTSVTFANAAGNNAANVSGPNYECQMSCNRESRQCNRDCKNGQNQDTCAKACDKEHEACLRGCYNHS